MIRKRFAFVRGPYFTLLRIGQSLQIPGSQGIVVIRSSKHKRNHGLYGYDRLQ